MQNTAISVKNLTKIYKLYDENIDRLKEALHFFGKKYHRDFYALNNVSFEIKRGETIGIIGQNGAGKSSLLKIISGVLTPSSGSVIINGRIASLLELGAGFNPEYTGMENIYLQGTLMGFSDKEMHKKIEAILSFADIGTFIDQQVKMYSSGMFARLAFAIVINLEPDILIVDEALSVGDFAFQYKCFQKFKQFQEEGRTILFVSHSAQQILQYCSKAILIHHGTLMEFSENVQQTLYDYELLIRNHTLTKPLISSSKKCLELQEYDFDTTPNLNVQENRFGTNTAIIREVILSHESQAVSSDGVLHAGKMLFLRFIVIAKHFFPSVVLGTSIKNRDGLIIWGANTAEIPLSLQEGTNLITMEFPLNITSGEYLLFCGLADTAHEPRIELDQRWPMEKLSIVSLEKVPEGIVFAPPVIVIENSNGCM